MVKIMENPYFFNGWFGGFSHYFLENTHMVVNHLQVMEWMVYNGKPY